MGSECFERQYRWENRNSAVVSENKDRFAMK